VRAACRVRSGGFYDHVPPPQEGVPSPDGICTAEGFAYTRLGVRIPTLAISPWVAKGTLVSAPPPAQRPTPTSQYELSSIPATLRRLFPQLGPPLTKRDEWAATFEHVLGPTLRTDTPTKLPDLPPPPDGELERQLGLPIDEHALGLIRTLCALAPPPDGAMDGAPPPAECGAHIRTYREFAPWVRDRWAAWLAA
jgi:phospholipase C